MCILAFSQKLGTYSYVDDILTLDLQMLMIDDPISVSNTKFQYQMIADFNNGVRQLNASAYVTLNRTGNEKPQLSIDASIMSDSNVPLNSKLEKLKILPFCF